MHFQYCGRQESQTDKAKLPWYRHIVPTQPKHQMGWRPTLIRYFIPWTINYFVVQWWCRRQNSGSIIGKGLPHHIQTGWGWESCHKQCPWAEHSLVRLIKVFLQRCPPSPTSTWAQRTNLDSNSMSSLQLQLISKQEKVWYKSRTLKGTSFSSSSTTLNSLMSSCHHLTVYSVFIDFVNDCFHLFCPFVILSTTCIISLDIYHLYDYGRRASRLDPQSLWLFQPSGLRTCLANNLFCT